MFVPRPYPKLTERHLCNSRVVPDRQAILPRLPKGGVFCEIGVALGTFSKPMVEVCRPSRFIAIDSFVLHTLTSLWGRPARDYFGEKTHEEFYASEMEPFTASMELTILKGDSGDQLLRLEDGSVDVFYVDADHSYEPCIRDLRIIRKKIRDGGLIVMNDYVIYDFHGDAPYGVVQAAHEFMVEEDWEMILFALQESMYCDIVMRKITDGR